MSDEQAVLASHGGENGDIGIIEINRADKFNCISTEVLDGFADALDQFESRAPGNPVRVILLRSKGKHFCTGADLEEVTGLLANDKFDRFTAKGHKIFSRFEKSRLPVVGACQGLSLAGGLELMMSCDVIFAGASAQFGDQHAQYGLVPGWGSSQRLPRIVGARRALDLLYTASWIDAEKACDWGLVNHVVPDDKLYDAAMEYCQALAKKSMSGLAAMKKLVYGGLEASPSEGLHLEERLVGSAMRSSDTKEGLAAFRERREPQFKKQP